MDRDVLACLNMVRCVYELLTEGTRLEWLQRKKGGDDGDDDDDDGDDDDDDGTTADLDDMSADES